MKTVVIYDSKFGNTERIARAIAAELEAGGPTTVLAASDASESDLTGMDLLAVGGPTQGHGISPALRDFLGRIPPDVVRDVPTVTFDTRLHWPRVLSGSAAATTAKRLVKRGARLLVPPESFLVTASEGPLAEGELARASSWARDVCTRAGLPAHEPVAAAE